MTYTCTKHIFLIIIFNDGSMEGLSVHKLSLKCHEKSTELLEEVTTRQKCQNTGRPERGRGSGAAVHLVADGDQRALRGLRRRLAQRVRGRPLPQPDGRLQLCRRRVTPRNDYT